MTATLNATRNKLLLCSVLCFILGAIFFAPCVNATDLTNNDISNASPDVVAQSIIDHYNLDPDKAVYMYFNDYNDREDMNYYKTVVFVPTNDDPISFTSGNNNGSPTAGELYSYNITSSNAKFYYISWYFDVNYYSYSGSYAPYNSNGTFYSNRTGKVITPQPGGNVVTYTYHNPVEWYANFDVTHITHNDEFVTFNSITPPVETTEETYSEVLLQDYLHENDINVDNATAWIILHSGQPVQIPISYSTPTNYNGDFYIRQTRATPYLDKFSVEVYNSDYDVSTYQNARVCICYNLNVTTLKMYGVYSVEPTDHQPTVAFDPTLPQGSNYTPNALNGVPSYYQFEGKSYLGRMIEMSDSQNVSYPVYVSWDMWLDPLSAIPRTHSLLVGIDCTVTDSNGNDVVGRDTNNYQTFVTNYNQQAIAGLTGTITGRTSFGADWSGGNVNTKIQYNDSFRIDNDTNISSVFTALFTMGNGFVTTLVIGSLSIALAAYILFGKR